MTRSPTWWWALALITARDVAEALLRPKVGQEAMNAGHDNESGLLCSMEPEIVIDAEGRQLILCIEVMREANDRYNSAQRPLMRHVSLQ